MARTRPIVQHWGAAGFGTPDGVYLLYLVKITSYVAGAIFFAALTPGFSLVGEWWAEPVVYQKLVLWTLLFEVLSHAPEWV